MTADPPLEAQTRAAELAERRRRLCLLGIVFGIGFLSIGLRLLGMVDWQHEAEASRGLLATSANAEPTPELAPDAPRRLVAALPRAEITDRNGELLATNILVPTLYVDTWAISDKDAAARALARSVAGVDAAQLAARLKTARRFALVKREVTVAEQRAVLDLGVPGVSFENAPRRLYPKRNLTSHVVGDVGLDQRGFDNDGQAGIERALNVRLAAGNGGAPLVLSIDLRVQQIVREELLSAYVRFRAKGANAMVLDLASGEMLAMVSLPDFDPNNPGRPNAPDHLNRNTGGVYELGSLLKVFTTAMSLDSGAVPLSRSFDATHPLTVGHHLIHDDHAKNRWLTVPECFMYSSNICMAQMAEAAGGARTMPAFFRKVGFFDRPGIELPPAELGRPKLPHRWPDLSVATAAFGHGVAISPLQFISGVAGLVGGSRGWVKPTLLRRDPGAVIPIQPPLVSARTSADLRWVMWLTVQKGTGEKAKQLNYLIGGKTGTADKASIKGEGGSGHGYRRGAVISSFIGAFPIDAPRYLVLAVLDEPHGDALSKGLHYAAWTAAPVVGVVVDRIGPLLGVPPTDPKVNDTFAQRLLVTKADGQREERVAALGPGR